MSKFLFFALLIFACCQSQNSTERDFPIFKRSWDSLAISRLKENIMGYYRQIPPDSLNMDTLYLMEMKGSWGDLYHYCLIFPDSAGYAVWTESRLSCDLSIEGCVYSTEKRRTTAAQWIALDAKVKESGFWTFDDTPLGGCADCEYYHIWVKQGAKTKLVQWSTVSKIPDSIRVLAAELMAMGEMPTYKPKAWFTEGRDSTRICIWHYVDTFFVKPEMLEYEGKRVPFSGGRFDLTVPRPPDYYRNQLPAWIMVNQKWINGIEQRFLITDFQKVTRQEFDRR